MDHFLVHQISASKQKLRETQEVQIDYLEDVMKELKGKRSPADSVSEGIQANMGKFSCE
ncbi:MAG: hypothetical protein H9917_00600 [Candidatus Oceanisphaera merdipullorum]|nr:hypothetical protein [Candidatus Oceanisphaera merdipullorum]